MPHNSIWTRIKAKWRDFLNAISYKQKVALTTLSGISVGLVILFMYLLRMHTYIIGDDPLHVSIAISCHLTMPRGAILPMVVM